VTLKTLETHSRRLMPIIEWIFKSTGTSWSDLDLVAVSLGPGSFTGLRIGLATGKGLAFALNIPIIGVSTLDSLATHVTLSSGEVACPVIDARKSQVYTAAYIRGEKGELKRISDYLAIDPCNIASVLPEDKKVYFLGDGLRLYQDTLLEALEGRGRIVPNNLGHVRAASVGFCAEAIWNRELKGHSIFELKPLYVRPSEAELNKKRVTRKKE